MEEEQRRALVSLFGVEEDDGMYVLIVGIILAGIAFLACFYCKVYDPTKRYCIKKWRKYCTMVPLDEPPATPDTPRTPEVSYSSTGIDTLIWYHFCVCVCLGLEGGGGGGGGYVARASAPQHVANANGRYTEAITH